MSVATGAAQAGELAGVIVATLLAGAALVAGSARVRAAAMLLALVLAPVLLAASVAGSGQLAGLRHRPVLAGAALVVGLGVVVALALVLARRPALLGVLAVLTLPFRIPISAGGQAASLLVPLYLVVGAGVLAHVVPRLRGRAAPPPAAGALEWLLAASLVLYAVASAWSADFQKALQQVAFFYVPFALLFALLREADWTPRVVRACLGVLVGLSAVFVAVGFVEYARRQLLLNPRVEATNELEGYFRVNSLFFDPNVYGRFLALVMLALATVALWRRGREVLAAGLALAVLWAGLLTTLSQSSFTALLAGLAVLAALRFGARRTGAAVAVVVVLAAAAVAVAPGALRLHLGSLAAANRATSGRANLVTGGLRLFASAPVVGHGSGSFSVEYRTRERAGARVSASHTIPITVAAEQGVVGLAVYLALLAAALARLLRGARTSGPRAYVGAAFVALLVHTLLYAAFLEDPIAWVLLAVGVALAGPAAGRRGEGLGGWRTRLALGSRPGSRRSAA